MFNIKIFNKYLIFIKIILNEMSHCSATCAKKKLRVGGRREPFPPFILHELELHDSSMEKSSRCPQKLWQCHPVMVAFLSKQTWEFLCRKICNKNTSGHFCCLWEEQSWDLCNESPKKPLRTHNHRRAPVITARRFKGLGGD